MSAEDGTYHALLARHDAMRLRRQMLSSGGFPGADGGSADGLRGPAGQPYDGSADQQTIMRDLDLVAPFEELIAHLYQALFTRHPSLRSLFPAEMAFQQAHLARAFWFLLEHLNRPDQITATFTQLGRDHRKLGVRPAQYAAFETALCEALRVRAGEHWTAELEQAWVRMVRFGVTAMVRGAEAALHEPPCWQATVTAHRLCGPDLAVLRVRPHETFRYRAGQYTALESARLPHTWRPYYLAGEPGRDGELEFHVRCTGPGGVSEALVRHTTVGGRIRLGPPKGNLALGEEQTGELRLVAWDTGWAPMKALLQELEGRLRPASAHRPGRVRLFLGADALSDLYDTEYLTEVERSRPWLTVVPVTGGTPGEGVYERLARAVTRSRPAAGGHALLAGPPSMVQTVTAALTRAGLPAEHVRHDPLPAGPRDLPGPVGDFGSAGTRMFQGQSIPA
ncbi:globin domain-containing protein [Streptomyces sp. 6-11-2]|uniref:globin domain-containing protein n=1 Tax=Streptomyces sp. 6-11-2 TaxID=2585753 RepID=UPI0011445DF8|nr:globin domain-containing protein [Streptomyces sp. 6-11-2]GED83660.1 oxidoreductase [Streptomyces sp. 6-11-2]